MHPAEYIHVPLWRRDGSIAAHALVDVEDKALVEGYRWHLGSNGYARFNRGDDAVLMHRVIMRLGPGDRREVDHVSRDKLDNRRRNLRLADHSQNMQNRASHRGSTSRFRAVYWDPARQVWRARTQVNKRRVHIGSFTSEIEAALAVEAWRRENMPFAEPDPEVTALVAMVQRFAA